MVTVTIAPANFFAAAERTRKMGHRVLLTEGFALLCFLTGFTYFELPLSMRRTC